MTQSQTTARPAAIGRAINNPPQKYPPFVKVGTRTFQITDNEGRYIGGMDNPCPIEVNYQGKVWSLAVNDTRIFPVEVADHLLERCPFLRDITAKVKVDKIAPADWREPTKEESPLYHRLKSEAARGHRMWALTDTGERVLLEPGIGAVGAPQPAETPYKSGDIETEIGDDTL